MTLLPLTVTQKQVTKEYYKEYFEITMPMFTAPREHKFLKRVGAPYFVAKERKA
jgi:hypothetical protein